MANLIGYYKDKLEASKNKLHLMDVGIRTIMATESGTIDLKKLENLISAIRQEESDLKYHEELYNSHLAKEQEKQQALEKLGLGGKNE